MKRITVFCSSAGIDRVSCRKQPFGQALATHKIELVYGGANVGLMGAVADGVLNGGGTVIGVIPDFLRSKEIAHNGLTELIVVDIRKENENE
jgi:predicted Rossmann-fold nucleotide-binding protein